MSDLKLVIGNKNYSSWSMRPWLALRASGIAFDEIRIPLYQPESTAAVLKYSPTGKVPVLIDGGVRIWESLAVLEYLAERHADRNLWPSDPAQRAHARAICSEMHAGFSNLRANLPMNLRRTFARHSTAPEVFADIARIQDIWGECLTKSGGPFLLGEFSNADAMFAPVVTRFLTYSVAVNDASRRYMTAVRALPALEEWYQAAMRETEMAPQYEYQP
jgi:glutathione S-transferase